MTSSNGNIFRVTGHLCGEFTGPRWIPHKKASDAELWYFSLIHTRINGWVNNGYAGDLRRHRAHYDVNPNNTTSSIQLNDITCLAHKRDPLLNNFELIIMSNKHRHTYTSQFTYTALRIYNVSHLTIYKPFFLYDLHYKKQLNQFVLLSRTIVPLRRTADLLILSSFSLNIIYTIT